MDRSNSLKSTEMIMRDHIVITNRKEGKDQESVQLPITHVQDNKEKEGRT